MNTDELIETIEREFYSFDVLQLVAVIEELLEYMDDDVNGNGRRDRRGDRPGRPLFFEADADLSFPPSDVGYVGINTGGRGGRADAGNIGSINDNGGIDNEYPSATVRLPVMNLLGAASPLPISFSDRIARGGRDADMYADFLSIMQNRLHALWIDACRKNAPWGAPTEKIFSFMTGLPIDKTGLSGPSLCGFWHLSNRTRSAQGLKELFYAAFGDIPINIEKNTGRYAAASNIRPLGGAARLGVNAAAGARVYDETAKFRVTIGPLDCETYESFLPGGENSFIAEGILSIYLNEPLICELAATCRIRDLPRARIGGERGRGGAIGRTAALGTGGGGTAAYIKTFARP